MRCASCCSLFHSIEKEIFVRVVIFTVFLTLSSFLIHGVNLPRKILKVSFRKIFAKTKVIKNNF